jgi:hypothetical protein
MAPVFFLKKPDPENEYFTDSVSSVYPQPLAWLTTKSFPKPLFKGCTPQGTFDAFMSSFSGILSVRTLKNRDTIV